MAQAVGTVKDIMKQVDIDRSGYIDYSEFLMASSKRETLLNEQNLELAFKIFDRSNTGNIGADDLYDVLGELVEGSKLGWEELIRSVDKDGNGLIDIYEFKEMMLKDL